MSQHLATWLADVLRAGGCDVVEYPGWEERTRPQSAGNFDARALFVHHDASGRGPSPQMARYIAEVGRPPGTPAPLSQAWVDTAGTWHVTAAGRSNHAGLGQGWGRVPRDSGNTYALGIETDHTTGEDWPPHQVEGLIRGVVAICRYLNLNPFNSVCGHKEYAAGRKVDPDGLDMDDFRAKVAAAIPSKKPVPAEGVRGGKALAMSAPTPAKPTPVVDKMNPKNYFLGAHGDHVTWLGQRLAAHGFGYFYAVGPGPDFTGVDRSAVRAFQLSQGWSGADADGFPGAQTLQRLASGASYRAKVVRLDHIVKAARSDPRAAQGAASYRAETLVVEEALADEGLLDMRYFDGSFGSLTVKAYAKWQQRIGYRGSAADGVPGRASLTALGKKHGFQVV